MRTVSAILSSEQGLYEWRIRDCVTTGLALYRHLCPRPRDEVFGIFQYYHDQPEIEAWRLAARRKGQLQVWRNALAGDAVEVDERAPGDFLFFNQTIFVKPSFAFDARRGRECLAFCGDDFAVLHWTPSGLKPIAAPLPRHVILRIK